MAGSSISNIGNVGPTMFRDNNSGVSEPLNANHSADTSAAGQVSSRTSVLMVETAEEDFTAVGGISDVNFSVESQSIPLHEIGSDKLVMVDGRPQPFRMNVSKNYVNGRNIIASLFYPKFGSATVPNFLMNIKREQLKAASNFALGVWDTSVKKLTASKLMNVYLEGYNLNIDADRVIISESISLIGENISDSGVTVSSANSEALTNADAFKNEADFAYVSQKGSVTSMTIVLAVESGSSGSGIFIPIGGLRTINLSLSNSVIPSPEIGSRKNFLVMGWPNPASIQMSKMFINQRNLLAALKAAANPANSVSKDTNFGKMSALGSAAFTLDIANDLLSAPRNYAFIIKTKVIKNGVLDKASSTQIINIKDARIINYNFSAGQQIVLQDNVVMTGEIGSDDIVTGK